MAVSTGAAILGGAVVGGVMSSKASSKTSKAAKKAAAVQAESAAEANAQLERLNKPFITRGLDAAVKMRQLTHDPMSYLQNNPMFEAALNYSGDQLKGAASVQGKFNSGGMVNQLFQNYLAQGNDQINQQYNRLLQPYSIGQNAAAFQGNQSAQLITGAGNAQAAGMIGAANASAQNLNNIAGITSNAIGMYGASKGWFK